MILERVFLALRAAAILLGATVITFLALPSMTRSLAWEPPRAPNFEGPYAVNTALLDAERLISGHVVGPEDVAFDPQGRIVTGTVDGKIVRAKADGSVELVTETGGRPLGLAYGPDGDLYVADALKGLLRVDREGHIEVLVREVEGRLLRFTNEIAIARDGTLYFTDSSEKWSYGDHQFDIIEQSPSGRLIRFDPRTRTSTVLMRGLSFANGVTLTEDERSLLVVETGRYRVMRLWLEGEKRNLAEPFVENLPGFPDNISRTPRGTYWIALYAPRKTLLDRLHPFPFLKDCVASLPRAMLPQPSSWGIAIELDADGRALRSLHDTTGRRFRHVSSAVEHDGQIYVGTLTGTAIGRATPPPLAP